jgi:hypothetical protein
MSYLKEIQDANELAKELINSTTNHVINKIHYQNDRYAYLRGMRYAYCSLKETSLKEAITLIEKKKKLSDKEFIPRLELFCDVKKYYVMALDHSLDILRSLKNRFVEHEPYSDFNYKILEKQDEYKGFL